MRLDGEEAAARRQIVGIDADAAHHRVGRHRETVKITRLVHMAVIVGPGGRNLLAHGLDRLVGIIGGGGRRHCVIERGLPRGERAPGAPVIRLQRLQDGDEIGVADPLQLADRMHAGLRVRLVGDGLYQLVGQLRHIHQLGPGPFQARSELRDEMRHSGLAAGHAIGLEQAHLRPAQAKAETDGVVDLLGGGDAVFHQPQRLAPDGLEETVGDKGLDFLADTQRMHADAGKEPGGALDGFGAG